MSVERYGSKTDVVVKLVLVFFIALLSFSVGTFVGKKFSDNQYKLSKLEPHKKSENSEASEEDSHKVADHPSDEHGANRGVASVTEGKSSAHGGGKGLSDDEIAKLAQEFVADDKKPEKTQDEHGSAHGSSHEQAKTPDSHGAKPNDHSEAAANSHDQSNEDSHSASTHKVAAANTHAEAHAEPKAEAKQTHQQAAPAHEAPLMPANRMANGHAPVAENPKASESRIPAALPKEVASSAIGKFTVQVSSFTSEKEAQQMSASLKEQGFSAFYVSAKVKNETRYRVSIGLFATAKEADSYMKDLLKRKKVESAIVQPVKSAN